jgi:hypothetical protein
MKKTPKTKRDPDMLDEYDFSKGVRGKYAARHKARSNVVVISPDLTAAFPNEQAVNDALRLLLRISKASVAKGVQNSRTAVQ